MTVVEEMREHGNGLKTPVDENDMYERQTPEQEENPAPYQCDWQQDKKISRHAATPDGVRFLIISMCLEFNI